MNYDPNLTNSGRMAKQTVELTFQLWGYKATKTTTVGGNCTGMRVITAAVENIEEELGYDEGEITLTNEAGDTMGVELWDHKLEDMVVGARITEITPDNE